MSLKIYALSIFTLASVSLMNSGGRAAIALGQGMQPLTITVTPSTPTLKAGVDSEIQISIKNTSDHPITLKRTNGDAFPDYDFTISVQDSISSRSTAIAPLAQRQSSPRKGSARAETIQPGESIQDRIVLARHFDMSKPGTYTIKVARILPKDYGGATSSSNIVQLHVVP